MLRLQNLTSKDFSARSFVVAGAILLAAVAIRLVLDGPLPQIPPFITLYPAVTLAGLLCGPWAAGIAGLVGVAAADFFWIPPRLSFGPPTLTDGIAIGLFIAGSAVLLAVTAALRAAFTTATVAKHAIDLGLAAGGVGTWEINLDTMRISASSGAYALHRLPESNRRTAPEDWLRGVDPDDAAVAREVLRKAVADGTTATYSYRVCGEPDGPRWIMARGQVVTTGGERRLLCALIDSTDQIRVQEELRRERERLRLALEAGALAVWDYNPDSDEAAIDTRYAATLGLDPGIGSLTREQIGALIHPEDRPRVVAEHAAIVASGSPYHIEFRIITPSGDVRWLSSLGQRIDAETLSDSGRMVGIIQDITERRRREDDLRDLATGRELLVREADHRIKNSLQLVISLLTVQLRGIRDPTAADALRGAIARVGAIAASHLALQGSENLRDIDFAVMLQELCAHFGQLHPAIAIVCRPDAAMNLDADRAIPLGLAVSEVLTNALRHAFPDHRSGKVVVDAAQEQSTLVVRVSDDGIGMPPAQSGGGLGSRIIRSLSAQLGAKIQVESAPKGGTVVTFRLLLTQEQPARRVTA